MSQTICHACRSRTGRAALYKAAENAASLSLWQQTCWNIAKPNNLSCLQVPYWQSRIVQGCRKRGKPVIVATNMLESMITNPTPTRAEVSDIAIAVREGTDAVMLSGETAYGKFPYKSVSVMATVAKRTENAMLTYQVHPCSNLFAL